MNVVVHPFMLISQLLQSARMTRLTSLTKYDEDDVVDEEGDTGRLTTSGEMKRMK